MIFFPSNEPMKRDRSVTPSSHGDVDLAFTDEHQRRAHIREALLRMIGSANEKVLFASFLFSDEALVDALCSAAEKLRGGVYVITALGKHMNAERTELDAPEDASQERRRARAQRHEELVRRMARAGVWLRSSEDAHAKLCVVDDQLGAVMSANATSEAFEINPEVSLLVRNPRVAHDLGRLFARTWLHRTTLDSEPGVNLNVGSPVRESAPVWSPLSSSGDVRVVATLGSDERSILGATLGLLESAQRELVIASYSLVGIENHPVGAALQKAARRVRIRMVLQPRNDTEAQRDACAWLWRSAPRNVEIRGLARSHSKGIVADGERALVWTGNLDGQHGYEDGFEVGLFTDRPSLVTGVRAYLLDLFERATHRSVVDPSAEWMKAKGIEIKPRGTSR